MALKTNFTDDILAESMNGKRQYNVTENSNGTKSLEDVTDYQSIGSTFSAKDMNETNDAVNQAHDGIRKLTEKILAETVDFGVVQINAGSTTGLAIPKKDGYTIASATPYSNSGSEFTQTNVITFVNAVSGAKKAFYKNTSSSAISNFCYL